jgi:uncharacterized RDD family membrane protein YckC
MTQPAGWYDDPQDPDQLRYWDGIIWSSHISPKISPAVAQSTIGMPHAVAPAGARPQSPGSGGAQGASTDPGGFASPRQGQGQSGSQLSEYGQGPGWPGDDFGQQPAGWQSLAATTPDGVVLSGWWKRVLARFLDNIIVSIVALPLVLIPLKNALTPLAAYFQEVFDAAQSGSSTLPAEPDLAQFSSSLLLVSVILLLARVVYEVAFLTTKGATPGKMAVGISVRLRDRPGPLPLAAALKRSAVLEGGGILALVPVVGSLGSLFSLIDSLWPLWDDKKQAIHDKAAATNVVVGRQPPRSS